MNIQFDKELTAFIKKRAKHNKQTITAYVRGLVVLDYHDFIHDQNLWAAEEITKKNPTMSAADKFKILQKIRGY